MRLNDPKKVDLAEYNLSLDGVDSFSTYAKGTYVQATHTPGSRSGSSARRLSFYQLPSANRGTEYSHWCISDLGIDMNYCEIDPEQDLLVLLELVDQGPGYRACKLYLRTMSTNQSHPKASGDGVILVNMPASASPPKDNFYSEISGRLLAVMFRTRSSFAPSHVMIWDWTTGVEIVVSKNLSQYQRNPTELRHG